VVIFSVFFTSECLPTPPDFHPNPYRLQIGFFHTLFVTCFDRGDFFSPHLSGSVRSILLRGKKDFSVFPAESRSFDPVQRRTPRPLYPFFRALCNVSVPFAFRGNDEIWWRDFFIDVFFRSISCLRSEELPPLDFPFASDPPPGLVFQEES